MKYLLLSIALISINANALVKCKSYNEINGPVYVFPDYTCPVGLYEVL